MRTPFSVKRTTLYILAGGKSSRFGEDKGSFVWKGKALIEHVLNDFSSFETAHLLTRKERSFPTFGLRSVFDIFGEGPLAGIHAALLDADTDWVFIVPCDTLGFAMSWLEAFEGKEANAIAFHDGQKWFPLFSAFHKDAIVHIEKNLKEGKLALWKNLDDLDAERISIPPGWRNLHRIDHKRDLA